MIHTLVRGQVWVIGTNLTLCYMTKNSDGYCLNFKYTLRRYHAVNLLDAIRYYKHYTKQIA